ncbi:SurA N-terminal domain-containing protein, partial [Streptococcus pneumoniae]|nr:SurA N-terminal domain-containing protein [Streptococcus pneumoniae]
MSVVIGNAVLLQDAKEKGHEADDAVVEERMEELKANFEDEDAMNEALAETGFTMEEMEEQLREQLVYESYMAEEID